jgi:hypothetical protein
MPVYATREFTPMRRLQRLARYAAILALAVMMAAQVTIARADLVDDLNKQSDSNQAAQAQLKKTKTTVTPAASTTTSGTPSGTTGPAIVPAATPLVVDSYAADPVQLQAGSRFTLSLVIKNPGTDDADDVVVSIGPSETSSGWGSSDALVILGNGSAQYLGAIAAGATNADASFEILANPASPGGVRSVPVTITWKAGDYQHTATEVVGLLVNSKVDLQTSIKAVGVQYETMPFGVVFSVRNNSQHAIKGLCVAFSGSGAQPSKASTITVGDLAPGASKTLSMRYSGPLVGRAKLVANLGYTDDFGDQRTNATTGWARIQRRPLNLADSMPKQVTLGDRIVAIVEALFGLSG